MPTQDFKGTINGFDQTSAWVTPTFDANNFSGYGSMTWTVEEADCIAFKYIIIGKTMIVDFSIVASSVGGTPNNTLRILIPESKTVAANYRNYQPISVVDNGAPAVWGVAEARAGLTYIYLNVNPTTPNWSASANQTYITGQITFEIN
jgi:hypothetical protein